MDEQQGCHAATSAGARPHGAAGDAGSTLGMIVPTREHGDEEEESDEQRVCAHLLAHLLREMEW